MDSDLDYDEFISHIQQCVVDLEKEEHDAAAKVTYPPDDSEEEADSAVRKCKRGAFEDHEISHTVSSSVGDIRPSKPLSFIIPSSYGRPRRSTANYGYPPRLRSVEMK